VSARGVPGSRHLCQDLCTDSVTLDAPLQPHLPVCATFSEVNDAARHATCRQDYCDGAAKSATFEGSTIKQWWTILRASSHPKVTTRWHARVKATEGKLGGHAIRAWGAGPWKDSDLLGHTRLATQTPSPGQSAIASELHARVFSPEYVHLSRQDHNSTVAASVLPLKEPSHDGGPWKPAFAAARGPRGGRELAAEGKLGWPAAKLKDVQLRLVKDLTDNVQFFRCDQRLPAGAHHISDK